MANSAFSASGPILSVQPCQGRITLTTATPVTTSDVTGATTVYFTPYGGNFISLYTSSAWQLYTFAELSIAVPATTSTMYDLWAVDSGGAVTLATTAWTNDTTRATAIAFQNGVYCKSGALGNRYLGSFRTTGVSGQTEDSLAKRYVWNYYNRIGRPMIAIDAAASWNYTTATFRQANANVANQLDMVIGVSENSVSARIFSSSSNTTATVAAVVGIGLDSTTVTSSTTADIANYPVNGNTLTSTASYLGYPGVGRHTLVWLEYSVAAGTTTWYGTSSPNKSGITGTISG
jgi:hypothetical protein